MKTVSYKLTCNGELLAFIFISEKHPDFPNCKVGIIFPFVRQGNWTTGDLELAGKKLINDIYNTSTTDEEIQKSLISRADLTSNVCDNFKIETV